jgi:hypothetical protein
MAKNIKKEIKKNKDISYLAKDFEGFRAELINYSKNHYGNKIIDFSETSVAGMFIDVASYVGDSLSYYLDHQFNELSLTTAIEPKNIENLARQSGVEIEGASPAFVFAKIRLTVPASSVDGLRVVNESFLPKILAGTKFSTDSGVNFYLVETIDFAQVDALGNLLISITPNSLTDGVVDDFIVEAEGYCTSAQFVVEKFPVGNDRIPFRTITLGNVNVHSIDYIRDSAGDEYYEVDSLTQDTVFLKEINSRNDLDLVPFRLKMLPAPKRFIKIKSSISGLATIRFGSGNEDTFDEDAIPDPSDHAVTLFGDRKTFSRVSIDPNSFLTTNTLGISPRNTTLSIKYSHGGGINHNIDPGELKLIDELRTQFKSSVQGNIVASIRRTASVTNEFPGFGGENAPSTEQIRNIGLLSHTLQKRVVTREDLLARIYNMPTNFGRVFRAAIRDNPNNQLATQLFVISRNKQGNLVLSPDTLKENMSIYLSKFRLISDAVDIVDASIVNLGIKYSVSLERGYSKLGVLQSINSKLKSYFNIKNFQIDQPILLGEVENIILNCIGVISLLSLKFVNIAGVSEERVYSNLRYSPNRNIDRGLLFPPTGGIFEIRFPNDDIVGSVL